MIVDGGSDDDGGETFESWILAVIGVCVLLLILLAVAAAVLMKRFLSCILQSCNMDGTIFFPLHF